MTLKRKLGEIELEATPDPPQQPQQQQMWQGDRGVPPHTPPQPEHFFQALERYPSLQPVFRGMDVNQPPPAWMV